MKATLLVGPHQLMATVLSLSYVLTWCYVSYMDHHAASLFVMYKHDFAMIQMEAFWCGGVVRITVHTTNKEIF